MEEDVFKYTVKIPGHECLQYDSPEDAWKAKVSHLSFYKDIDSIRNFSFYNTIDMGVNITGYYTVKSEYQRNLERLEYFLSR